MILHLAPRDPRAEALSQELSGAGELRRLHDLSQLEGALEERPEGDDPFMGFLVLGPGLTPGECLAAVELATATPGDWVALHAREADPGPQSNGYSSHFVLRSLSLGWPEPPSRLGEVLAGRKGDPDPRPILELRDTLRMVARIRHDVNNPLTAAMAEVQLLLMDLERGTELQESVELVQEQLRRIRDEIAQLARLRAPRPSDPGVGPQPSSGGGSWYP